MAIVVFTNSSQNAQSFRWEFGDGAISNDKDPSHTFIQSAVYVTRLKAARGRNAGSATRVVPVRAGNIVTNFLTTTGLDILSTSGGDPMVVS